MAGRILREHRALAFVLGIFVALGIGYSVTTPLFETPDEVLHFAFVQHLATGRGLPVQTVENSTHLARQEGSQPPLYYLLAAALTFWVDTSDYPGIVWENPHYGYNVPGVVNDNKNLYVHTTYESFPYHGTPLAIHLARLLSVLMGALAVLFTYALTLEIWPQRRWLAAAAAAVVGWVPQFSYISGAVSNDSTIVAMSALSLWIIVRILCSPREPDLKDVAALGLAAGLGALAKVSGAGLILLGGGVLVYAGLRRHGGRRPGGVAWRQLARNVIVFGVAAAIVVGWWYLRNLISHGEPTGTVMMSRIFGARQTPLTGAQLLTQLAEVWETFWIGFGWGNIRAPGFVYTLLAIGVGASGLGLLFGLVRHRAQLGARQLQVSALALLAGWIVIALVELLQWMQMTQAPHGRLLFPMLPAIAPLAVLGLLQWAPPRFAGYAAGALAAGWLALALVAPFAILQPAYAYPAFLARTPELAHPVDLSYGGKIRLLGYEIAPDRVAPGGAINLTLYWQSLAAMDDDYSIGIHLLDSAQQVVGARDSYPGHGLLPTRLWQPGQILRDTYWVPVAAAAPPASVAQIQVDLYSRATKTTLAALDPQGEATTPLIGRLKITGSQAALPRTLKPTEYVFGKQLALIGYDFTDTTLLLYWQRTAAVTSDYTVFVHYLSAGNTPVAQHDGQPGNGASPTSLWDQGEVVLDVLPLPDAVRGTYRVELGLYRGDTGERLPVTGGGANSLGDHVTLGPFEAAP